MLCVCHERFGREGKGRGRNNERASVGLWVEGEKVGVINVIERVYEMKGSFEQREFMRLLCSLYIYIYLHVCNILLQAWDSAAVNRLLDVAGSSLANAVERMKVCCKESDRVRKRESEYSCSKFLWTSHTHTLSLYIYISHPYTHSYICPRFLSLQATLYNNAQTSRCGHSASLRDQLRRASGAVG